MNQGGGGQGSTHERLNRILEEKGNVTGEGGESQRNSARSWHFWCEGGHGMKEGAIMGSLPPGKRHIKKRNISSICQPGCWNI